MRGPRECWESAWPFWEDREPLIAFQVFQAPHRWLSVLFPKISREGHQAPLGRYLAMGMPLMTVLAIAVIYFRYEILAFFQPAFIPAGSALIFLMLTLPLVYCNSLLANYLVTAERIGMLVRRALVLVPLNIGLNLFLIPRYGIEGAATATLLCEICLAVLFVLARRSIRSGIPAPTAPPGRCPTSRSAPRRRHTGGTAARCPP